MHKTLCLALLLAATAHALAADDATSKQTADFRQWQKRADAEQAAADSALTDLQQRAAAGDATAQFEFGVLYYSGQGVAQDYGQARAWWEKAAAQGHAKAQYNLGLLYAKGQGVAQDYGQARVWWEKAAAQGDAKAQYALGVLYDNGHGVAQDYGQARAWWEKAAAQTDDQEAQQAAQLALQKISQ